MTDFTQNMSRLRNRAGLRYGVSFEDEMTNICELIDGDDENLSNFLILLNENETLLNNKILNFLKERLHISLTELRNKLKREKRDEKDLDYSDLYESAISQFEIITLSDSQLIMVKENNHYSFDIDGLKSLINTEIENLEITNYRRAKGDAFEFIRDKTLFKREDFTYNKDLIVFENCVYNINTNRILTESELEDMKFFYEIPHNFEFGEFDCPNFKNMLNQWLESPNQVVLIDDIFEMIGYLFTIDISFKKAFFNFGFKNTGKTQFTNILMSLIGNKNIAMRSLQSLNERFGTARLDFISLNISADMPNSKLKDVSAFKNATGGDEYVSAEIKGGNHYKFKPILKFWFNANQIPQVEDHEDDAFFGRFILLHFCNQFERDGENFENEIWRQIIEDESEMQGIIHQAIAGLMRLHRRGYFRLELEENTKHLWLYNADIMYRFVFDKVDKIKDRFIETDAFYEKYNEYMSECGLAGVSNKAINTSLKRLSIHKSRFSVGGRRPYVFKDIFWKPEPEPEPEEPKLIINTEERRQKQTSKYSKF